MASWLWDFILGREHKEPIVEEPKYDPFTDASLHKIERMDNILRRCGKKIVALCKDSPI